MAMPTNRLDREYDKFIEDASGKTAVNTNLVVQDIEIGAVEIKDHDGEDRAAVSTSNELQVRQTVGNQNVAVQPETSVTSTNSGVQLVGGHTYEAGHNQAMHIKVNSSGTIFASVTGTATVTQAGNVTTVELTPTTLYNNQEVVTTAGTAVQLPNVDALSITIKALVGNTGLIYVGDSSVSSSNGFELSAGDSISLAIAEFETAWIDSSVSGEGVSIIGVNT